jgi:iron complex transport system substrate-binding protein
LVGISHECDYPPEIKDRAVCTSARLSTHRSSGEIHQEVDKLLAAAMSIYEINLDVLTQLQPTHIITQDQCDVCAVSFPGVEKAVAKLTNCHPQIISLQPDTIADVWADIQQWQQLAAVKQNRVYITDGNAYFNRPGPRLVESLEILTEILNPQVCNYGHYQTGWAKFS